MSRLILFYRPQRTPYQAAGGLRDEDSFAAGESIFREGGTDNRFYLIEEGEVAVESTRVGAPAVVDHVYSGDLLGWSSLFPPSVWHFGTRAVKPTTAISSMERFCGSTAIRIIGWDMSSSGA